MPEALPQTNRPALTVQLAPPRPPLPESFWRAYRLEIAGGLLLVLAGLIAAIVLGRRSKPAVRVPPAAQARKELEILRLCGSRTGMPIEIARVIRRFVMNQFGLAPDEMTTTELCQALRQNDRAAPDAAGLVADLLRRCDLMKFAPGGTAAEADLVTEAMQLVERVEGVPPADAGRPHSL